MTEILTVLLILAAVLVLMSCVTLNAVAVWKLLSQERKRNEPEAAPQEDAGSRLMAEGIENLMNYKIDM